MDAVFVFLECVGGRGGGGLNLINNTRLEVRAKKKEGISSCLYFFFVLVRFQTYLLKGTRLAVCNGICSTRHVCHTE